MKRLIARRVQSTYGSRRCLVRNCERVYGLGQSQRAMLVVPYLVLIVLLASSASAMATGITPVNGARTDSAQERTASITLVTGKGALGALDPNVTVQSSCAHKSFMRR
jgi:hypothetical protein